MCVTLFTISVFKGKITNYVTILVLSYKNINILDYYCNILNSITNINVLYNLMCLLAILVQLKLKLLSIDLCLEFNEARKKVVVLLFVYFLF